MTDMLPSEISPAPAEPDSSAEGAEWVDINTASQRKLLTLPGIGRAMANRIQAARPFAQPDDLLRVSGVSEAMLEKLRPRVVALPLNGTPVSEETGPEADSEPQSLEDLSLAEINPPPAEVPQEEAAPAPEILTRADPSLSTPLLAEQTESGEKPVAVEAPRASTETKLISTTAPANRNRADSVSAGQVVWMCIGSATVALILALIFSLGILAAMNGGLRYVTPVEMAPLSRDVAGIGAQADALRRDMDSLRQRLDSLEGLTGRMTTLEGANQALRMEVDAASTQVDDMRQTLEGMSTHVNEMQTDLDAVRTQTSRFKSFLDGLENLLSSLPQP